MQLAPIGLSTYSRLRHIQQTVEALQRNTLAPYSDLYVFSDAPQPGDEEKVQAVRDFLRTVSGFKRVEIIERQTNSRTYNNRQGIRMLLEMYGKMIFMEEDILTAPSFLNFMNQALETYEGNKRVFSIAGYCPPINFPKDYPYDAFIHPRFNPWGFGIWKDRFDLIEMKIPKQVIKTVFFNPKNLYKFSKLGPDMIPNVINNYFEFADGLDIRIIPQEFVLNMFTVYPTQYLVDNIGVDGSGMHARKKDHFRVDLFKEEKTEYKFPNTLEINPEIMESFFKFRTGNLLIRIGKLFLWFIYLLSKKFLSTIGKTKP